MNNSNKISKKCLLLLSGGIDSPIAAYLMQKKGYELVALHFYNKHIGDVNTIDKCKQLCQKLNISKLIAIPFDQQQAELVRKCEHKYYYILQRRLMWRIAEKVAEHEHAQSLITGDNIAQVASQTLSNMTTIQNAVKIPILRPLLCNDKQETIDLAKQIDTYELSSGPEICCLLGPKHPATFSNIQTIEEEEMKVDVAKLVAESVEMSETFTTSAD